MSPIDIHQIRADLFDPFKPPRAITMMLYDGDTQTWANDEAATLNQTFPGDTVLNLHVPDLLADRQGPGRGLLAHLLAENANNYEDFLASLRGLIPPTHTPISWLNNATALSIEGGEAVADALEGGDFSAAQTLLAHTRHQVIKENTWIENEFKHVRSTRPLTESDTGHLVDLVMREPQHERVRWIIFSGMEHTVAGASPHAAGFRKAMRHILGMARGWPRTVFIGVAWTGAHSHLTVLDPALERIAVGDRPESPCPVPTLSAVRQGLRKAFSVSLQERHDLASWIGIGSQGCLTLIWPDAERDPAARVVVVATRAMEIIVGARMAMLVPEWAMGREHAQDRSSMVKAKPHMRWIPLSLARLNALARAPGGPNAPDDAHLQDLRQQILAAWTPDG